jgi:hypothetical protein
VWFVVMVAINENISHLWVYLKKPLKVLLCISVPYSIRCRFSLNFYKAISFSLISFPTLT